MRISLILLLLVMSTSAQAQYLGGSKVNSDEIEPWVAGSKEDYAGTYKFGFSEGECEFRILGFDSLFVAQSVCYTWNRSKGGFIDTFFTFSDVRIEGNKFYSKETNGEFIKVNRQDKTERGLLINKPWTYQFHEGGEVGLYISNLDNSLHGDYPEASYRILTKAELKGLDYKQLRLMRNEIFARYGLIFKKGRTMDNHFRNKDWYSANYRDVSGWLTEIERINIKLLRKLQDENAKTF